mmetsp:Transcript_10598/g.7923  ORF Transcript_10598/g.7923 Transcript_10598/m.7923 type:complete len:182 (+) Transcript_10598:48-593(+)
MVCEDHPFLEEVHSGDEHRINNGESAIVSVCDAISEKVDDASQPEKGENEREDNNAAGKENQGAFNYKAAALITVGAVAVGYLAGPAAIAGGLSYFGFTINGIAAGSPAAIMQSSIGNVVAGSVFSFCQSLGATGAVATAIPTATFTGCTGALTSYLTCGKNASKNSELVTAVSVESMVSA